MASGGSAGGDQGRGECGAREREALWLLRRRRKRSAAPWRASERPSFAVAAWGAGVDEARMLWKVPGGALVCVDRESEG